MASYHPLGFFLLILFHVSTYFSMSYAQVESTTRPEVTISQGTLLGITVTTLHGRNVSAFLGIPYGQPPTGNLRFANPLPAEGWNGTRDASDYGSWCPQYLSGVTVGEEDCLSLNVFTPQLSEDTNSSLLPVMVFIHGGGFQIGRSDQAAGHYLLDVDVVHVAMNYRLGPLGFLSTGDEVASGNWGLKDQKLALEWVRDNIHHFGGDPGQVTIFGESAGADSVHIMTLSESTIGLFHRYITQSGCALASWAYAPRAAYSRLAFELGEYVGCSNDTSASLISCLRERIDFSDIMGTHPQFNTVWGPFPGAAWVPTDEPDIEGSILTDSPSNLFAAGQIRDLPWMSGITRDEGLYRTAELYVNESMLLDFVENYDTIAPIMLVLRYQSDSGAAWTSTVKSYYFNNDLTTNRSLIRTNLTLLAGDGLFVYPARKALQQHHDLASNPQYFYTFDYRGTFSYMYADGGGTGDYGVTHGDDLIYLFPLDPDLSALNLSMSETDYEMVDTMVQLFTSFAINGIPTASALEIAGMTWEPFSTEDAYLRIGNESDTSLNLQYSYFQERMEFWANLDAVVDSGTAISSPNLVILLLAVCSKFVFSAATIDRLG